MKEKLLFVIIFITTICYGQTIRYVKADTPVQAGGGIFNEKFHPLSNSYCKSL